MNWHGQTCTGSSDGVQHHEILSLRLFTNAQPRHFCTDYTLPQAHQSGSDLSVNGRPEGGTTASGPRKGGQHSLLLKIAIQVDV